MAVKVTSIVKFKVSNTYRAFASFASYIGISFAKINFDPVNPYIVSTIS